MRVPENAGMALRIPVSLAAVAARPDMPELRAWVATLPRVVEELTARWELTVGEPYDPGGQCSWVAPAGNGDGEDLVLKVGWRHMEAEHEAAGLRRWDGRGAVRLRAAHAFDQTSALLLERCVPGTPLGRLAEPEQDVVVADLLRRLWQAPVGAPFRPLAQMCDAWAGAFEARPSGIDAGLARVAMTLFRSLPRTAGGDVLLCTDLHAGNILAARRERWLVVDPKPYVGDPAYDVLQHMLNCRDRLAADPAALARRLAGLLDLDAERVTLWLFARCVQESADDPTLVDVARRLAP